MNKQMTLSVLTDELAQARTRKKEFPGNFFHPGFPWAHDDESSKANDFNKTTSTHRHENT